MPKVWILKDNRIGNFHQALSLGEMLGYKYEIKDIEYNILSYLPNFIIGDTGFHITKSCKQDINSSFPDILISSGRRTASVSLYIKNLSSQLGHNIKIIQILNPELSFKKFDLVMLPFHDKVKNTKNVIKFFGAINNIHNKIKSNDIYFIDDYKKGCIGVLIGGSRKNFKFKLSDAESLGKILIRLKMANSLPLCITFSRRTPNKVKKYFYNNFSKENDYIYDPMEKGIQNIYLGILKFSKYIIATNDSISMCSEVLSSHKPLYLFDVIKNKSSKHKYFTDNLVQNGVKLLNKDTFILNKYKLKSEMDINIKNIKNIIKIGH